MTNPMTILSFKTMVVALPPDEYVLLRLQKRHDAQTSASRR